MIYVSNVCEPAIALRRSIVQIWCVYDVNKSVAERCITAAMHSESLHASIEHCPGEVFGEQQNADGQAGAFGGDGRAAIH